MARPSRALPAELAQPLVAYALPHLGLRELAALRQTSRAWRDIIDCDSSSLVWHTASKGWLPASVCKPAQDQESGGANVIQHALRKRGNCLRKLCTGTLQVAFHQTPWTRTSAARSHGDQFSFSSFLEPQSLKEWSAMSVHAIYAPSDGNRSCQTFINDIGEERTYDMPLDKHVKVLQTSDDRLRILLHLRDSTSAGDRAVILDLAVIDHALGHVVATRTVQSFGLLHMLYTCSNDGTRLSPDPSYGHYAWQSSGSSLTLTRAVDLVDVTTIQLGPPAEANPQPSVLGILSHPCWGTHIIWSADGKFLAICRFQYQDQTDTEEEVSQSCKAATLLIYRTRDGLLQQTVALAGCIGTEACFSPDNCSFALWGAVEGQAIASSELLILNVISGAITRWHHKDFETPVPCDCDDMVWALDSKWLAVAIGRPPQHISPLGWDSEIDDEDTNWKCWYAANGQRPSKLLRLDNTEQFLRLVVDAATGQVKHIWKGRSMNALVGDIQVCNAGLLDTFERHFLYVGSPETVLKTDLPETQHVYSLPGQALQVVLCPQLPIGRNAALSPCGTVIVDFSVNVHVETELSSEYEYALFHFCPEQGSMHIIVKGCYEKLHGRCRPVWLPCSPQRLMYALTLADYTICLVDARRHCLVRSWKPALALPVPTFVRDPMPLSSAYRQCEPRWVSEGHSLVVSYRGHPQISICADTTFVACFV
ncbi:hypothetical protein WJX74_009521 [Apatococcus lobatus]|uniref:F-box domain-containing protein n=2 Tax=Apatococcus TaxID=904362 RepID=A0AAW1S3N1_9CHLO